MISELLTSAADFIERFGFPAFFGVVGAAIFWKLINATIASATTDKTELGRLRLKNEALEKRLTQCIESKTRTEDALVLDTHIKHAAVQELLDDTQVTALELAAADERISKLEQTIREHEETIFILQGINKQLKTASAKPENSGTIEISEQDKGTQ